MPADTPHSRSQARRFAAMRGEPMPEEFPHEVESLIAELERVGEASTPAPWGCYLDEGCDVIESSNGDIADVNCNIGMPFHENARFIWTARNRWDAIITALRENIALRAERDELRCKVAQLKAASPFQMCPSCARPQYAAGRCEHCGHKSPLAEAIEGMKNV